MVDVVCHPSSKAPVVCTVLKHKTRSGVRERVWSNVCLSVSKCVFYGCVYGCKHACVYGCKRVCVCHLEDVA